MIYEQQGEVVAVSGTLGRVRMLQACDADRCATCGLCSSGAGQKPMLELEVRFPEPPKTGDLVRLRVHMPNQGLVAILVFGLPLTGVLLGGLGGMSLLGGLGDAGLVLGGTCGLAAGFGLVALANRKLTLLHAYAELAG